LRLKVNSPLCTHGRCRSPAVVFRATSCA
jgi:hypothetical protein